MKRIFHPADDRTPSQILEDLPDETSYEVSEDAPEFDKVAAKLDVAISNLIAKGYDALKRNDSYSWEEFLSSIMDIGILAYAFEHVHEAARSPGGYHTRNVIFGEMELSSPSEEHQALIRDVLARLVLGN